jgi:hypothetical protein
MSVIPAWLRRLMIAAILLVALPGGWFLGQGTAVGYLICKSAYLEFKLDQVQERAQDLTVRIEVRHQTPSGVYGGRATGIVIKPGKNGNGRILTNGHVCDMAEVLPETLSEFLSLTEVQSRYLPVIGNAIFFGGAPVPLGKILIHLDWPDVCVVELKGPSLIKDYADFEFSYPEVQERMVIVGHPGGELKLAAKGTYQGILMTYAPPRRYDPSYLGEYMKLKARRSQIIELVRRCQFVIDLFSVMGTPQSMQRVAELRFEMTMLKVELALNDTLLSRLNAPVIGVSAVVNVWTIGGASGSGIWNARGKLVAMIWGGYVGGGNLAFCVTPTGIESVIKKLPE